MNVRARAYRCVACVVLTRYSNERPLLLQDAVIVNDDLECAYAQLKAALLTKQG